MKLLISGSNGIVAYATYGGLEGGIEFKGSIPDDFEANFKPNYYLYQNNEIVVNPNYQEPTVDIPTPEPSGPSPEMLAINALGIQLAKHLAGGD